MYTRLLLSSVLFAASACVAAESNDDLAKDSTQELGRRRHDAVPRCGRYYPVLKDNRTPQLPKDDVELIDTLVPHHQMAVSMAEQELEHGADPELKDMAASMKQAQADEIAQLIRIRREITGCETVTSFADPHMEQGMAEMMELSGSALDLKFADDMIPHHASALQFTHYALPNLKHPELREIAKKVIDAQAMEVGHLHMVKQRLNAAGPDAGVIMGTPAPCTSDADCGAGRCVDRPHGKFCDVPEMVEGGGHESSGGH